MYFIILPPAATLHAHGQTHIGTAQQAAEALRPLAGNGAYLLFTLGVIGAGMLGVPVLAGSTAYALPEGFGWRCSLKDKPHVAPRFYTVVRLAMLVGIGLTYCGIAAVAIFFLSAVVNGCSA